MPTINVKNNHENSKEKLHKKKKMGSLAGNLYQVKLLMLFLYKGLVNNLKYKLGTEIEEADKFDDLVFRCKDVSKDLDYFILVQAKHTTNKVEIDTNQLLVSHYGDFGLFKYYKSLKNAKNDIFFKNSAIKRAIIYTNRTFDTKSKFVGENLKLIDAIVEINLEECEYEELDLCLIEGKGEFYRFKTNVMLPLLKRVFVECTLNMIAKCFADSLTEKPNQYREKEIKRYRHVLMEEVVDVNTKKFKEEFINGQISDSVELIQFRNLLISHLKAKKHTLETINSKDVVKFSTDMNEDDIQVNQKQTFSKYISNYVNDDDVKEFLAKFVIATNQSDENTLDRYIREKMMNDFDNDQFYKSFFNRITDWAKGEEPFSASTDVDERFISYKEVLEFFTLENWKINSYDLNGPIIKYENMINKYHIHFCDDDMGNIINDLLNFKINVLLVSSLFVELCSVKIYQILSVMWCKCIFIKLNSFNQSSIALKSFSSNLLDHSLIIIVCDGYKRNEIVENQILHILHSNRDKKAIIISKNDNNFITKLSQQLSRENVFKTITDEKLQICDLISFSQKIVLNKSIKFQDSDVDLKHMINQYTNLSIEGELLTKLLMNEDVKIGQLSLDLVDINQCYINRKFFVNFNFDENNIILISGIDEKDFHKGFGNIDIDLAHNDKIKKNESVFFNTSCEKNPNKKVCLLRKDNQKMLLVAKSENFYVQFDKLPDEIKKAFDKNIILLNSCSGMGKTFVFSHLRDLFKALDPSLWVYKIDLNNFYKILQEIQKKKLCNGTLLMKFLFSALNLNSDLEKKIFETFIEEGRVVLFLDGLDEISPQYSNAVINIVKALNGMLKMNRIFINTRPYDYLLNSITQNFNALSCELQQFTEEDQIEFLKIFWHTKNNFEFIESSFMIFVSELLTIFNATIKDDGRSFLGTALHIMMIATSFQDTYHCFVNSQNNEIDETLRQQLKDSLNLFSLYENFIEIKCFEIYYKGKNNLDLSNPRLQEMAQTEHNEYIKKCQLLSLIHIFDIDKLSLIANEECKSVLYDYKNEIILSGDRFGFIIGYRDDRLHFIHRTFPEFFVAKYIVKSISNNNSSKETVISFFLNEILADGSEMICKFINDAFDCDENDENLLDWKFIDHIKDTHGSKLHFVLKHNCHNVAKILIENEIDVTHVDDNNETVFHFLYDTHFDHKIDCDLTELILKENSHNKKEALKDMLLKKSFDRQKSPLLLAIRNKNANTLRILIRILVDLEIFNIAVQFQDIENNNVLHLALSNKSSDVFQFIINELKKYPSSFEALLETKNNHGLTPLLLATLIGNIKYIECIVSSLRELNILEAAFNSLDIFNNGILNLAAVNENSDVLKFLIDETAISDDLLRNLLQNKGFDDRTPLLSAAFEGNSINFTRITDALNKLNILEIELISQDSNKNNILHFAIYNENNVFELIIEKLKSNSDLIEKLIQNKGEYGATPLIQTVIEGNFKYFTIIMDLLKGSSCLKSVLLSQNEDGNNFLHMALFNKRLDILKYTINDLETSVELMKSLLRTRNKDYSTPLMVSVTKTDIEFFKCIFDTMLRFDSLRSEIFSRNAFSNNILQMSVYNESSKIFKHIVEELKSYPEIFKVVLLNNGFENRCSLVTAARGGNVITIEKLYEMSSQFGILERTFLVRDIFNNNILQLSIMNRYFKTFEFVLSRMETDLKLSKMMLLNKGFNDRTCLLTAAFCGRPEHLKCLFKILSECDLLEMEILSCDSKGNNIIQLSIRNENFTTFDFILDVLKSQPDRLRSMLLHKNDKGMTPLMTSAESGSVEHFTSSLNVLSDLNLWSEISSCDLNGNNVIELSIHNHHSDVFERIFFELKSHQELFKTMLFNEGFEKRTPVLTVAYRGDATKVKLTQESLLELNILDSAIVSRDAFNNDILQLSITNGYIGAFEFFASILESNLNLLKSILINEGFESRTPLLRAAYQGNLKQLKFVYDSLKKCGLYESAIVKRDSNHRNILHLSISNDDPEVFEFVMNDLESNPKLLRSMLWYTEYDGRTVLMTVFREGTIDQAKHIVGILKMYNVFEFEFARRDDDNDNVLQVSIYNNNMNVFDYVVEELKSRPELFKKMLLNKGFRETPPILTAVRNGNGTHLKCIFEALDEYDFLKSEINSFSINDNSVLELSYHNPNTQAIEFIMNKLKSQPELFETLLSMEKYKNVSFLKTAILGGSMKHIRCIFKFLKGSDFLEKDLHSCDVRGDNVLHVSIRCENVEVFTWVMSELKSRPELMKETILNAGFEDRTPLMTAVAEGKMLHFARVFDELVDYGLLESELGRHDSEGRNFVQLAVFLGKDDVLDYVERQSVSIPVLIEYLS